MEPFVVVVIVVVIVLLQAAHYRGHINDLRDALDRERKMRRYEEARAETLSDALFGHVRTRRPGDEKLRN